MEMLKKTTPHDDTDLCGFVMTKFVAGKKIARRLDRFEQVCECDEHRVCAQPETLYQGTLASC